MGRKKKSRCERAMKKEGKSLERGFRYQMAEMRDWRRNYLAWCGGNLVKWNCENTFV